MSISIRYADLKDAAEDIRTLSNHFRDVKNDASSFLNMVAKVDGTDTCGYVASAAALVKKKMETAAEKQTDYTNLATALDTLYTNAKDTDKKAEESINTTVTGFVGERSWFQKLKDAIYEGYVNFLDRLEGTGILGKVLAQFLRTATTFAENAYHTALNWFKYGAGKYVLNIVMNVVAVVGAVAAALAAVAAAIAAAPVLAVIATIGAVAAIIYLVCKSGDAATSIYNDVKALRLNGEGNYTAARYYGNVNSVEDAFKRYDMGDASQNQFWEKTGEVYSAVRDVSQATATVCTLVTGVGNAGLTRNPATGAQMVDWKTGFKTYVSNNIHGAGGSTFGTDWKRAMSPKSWTGNYGSKLSYFNFSQKTLNFFSGAKVVDNVLKTNSRVSNVIDFVSGNGDYTASGGYDTFKDSMKLLGNNNAFDKITGDSLDVVFDVVSGGSSIVNIFTNDSSPNMYQEYLARNNAS